MRQSSSTKLLLFFAFLIPSIILSAQEQLGFHTDNYSGINSVLLNPAGHANTPFNWDVNLVEGAFFLENNYFDLTPFRLLDVRDVTIDDFHYGPEVKDPSELPPGAIIQDFVDDGRKRFANVAGHIMGPSFFVRINESSTIGLTTNFRMAGSGAGITDNLSYYTYFDQPLFDDFQVDKFSLGLMSWGEIGLNYMHQIEVGGGELAIGATAKYLTGYEAAFLYSDKDFLLTKLPGDTLSSNAVSFNYGYTSSNLDMETVQVENNGRGVGVDLGFVYTARDFNDEYLWKIGVSLLDVGRITFDQNAREHLAQADELVVLATEGFQNIEDLQDFESKLELFSDQVLGDSSLSFLDGEFSMWLPTALSIQADYKLAPYAFVNATLVQGLPLGGVGARRGSLLAVTPRFEHRWFGAALPLSVYNWQDVRVGLAARVAFLSVGTSNLGSIFGRNTFTGTDFYFAVKVNPFDLGLSGRSRGGKSTKRGRSSRSVKCYEF